MEFLLGKSLKNNIYNLSMTDLFQQVLQEMGMDLKALEDIEEDAALGNGGLGRLAACYMDCPVSPTSSRYRLQHSIRIRDL